MRSVRLLTRLPGNGTPLSETAELLGEPSKGPAKHSAIWKHCSGPAPRGRTTAAPLPHCPPKRNLRRPRTAGALLIRRGTERRSPGRRRRMARAGRRPRSTKPGPEKRSAAPLAHARTVAVRRRNRHSRSPPANLQQRWSTEVVGPVEGLQDEALQQALIAARAGLLWTFVADAAQPFLRPAASGYAPASALGMRFPLSPAFLSLLSETPQHIAVYPASVPCAGGVLTSHGQPKSTGLSPRSVLAHGLRRRTSPGGCLQLPRNRPVRRLVAGTMRQPDIGDPV